MKDNDKLDRVIDELGEIKVILAKQEVNIYEHIRRTNLLEESLKIYEGDNLKAHNDMSDDMKPLMAHVNMINGAFKLIGLVGVGVGIVVGLVEIISYIAK